MIQKLKKAVGELQENSLFKEFKEENPDNYLTSCLIIIDNGKTGDWEADYYQPKKHKITTFVLKEVVESKGEDDIFQKEKIEIEELKLSKVKLNLDRMLKKIENYRKKKHPGDYPGKIIAVLQNLNDKTVWNVTQITSTLKIWNIKLDAKNGKVIEESIENVFSLKAK